MKKISLIGLFLMLLCIPTVSNAVATNSSIFAKNKIYVLYGDDCKKCDQEKEALEETYKDDSSVRIEYIHINDDKEFIKKIKKNLKISYNKVPITIIGTTYFTGFNHNTLKHITKAVSAYDKEDNYCDIVASIKNKEDIGKCLQKNQGIYKENSVIMIIGIAALAIIICFIIFRISQKKRKSL